MYESNGVEEIGSWNEPLQVQTMVNQLEPPPSGSIADAFANMLDTAKRAAAAAQAAAQADIQAEAEGRQPPSELDPTYSVSIGSETETPYVMAGGGLAEAIEGGLPGDLAARLGLPRRAATWLIGVGVAIGLAQAVRFGSEV